MIRLRDKRRTSSNRTRKNTYECGSCGASTGKVTAKKNDSHWGGILRGKEGARAARLFKYFKFQIKVNTKVLSLLG